MFFDYLNLKDKKLERIIILYGRSGSGKSSYAKHIKEYDSRYTIVDEIWSVRQLPKLFSIRNKKLIICSHLPEKFFFFLKDKSFFNIDSYPQKIGMELRKRGYTYSKDSIETFYKQFKTSYMDLDIILEESSNKNFDLVLGQFFKNNRIQHRPIHSLVLRT